jgi:hypothetical protein
MTMSVYFLQMFFFKKARLQVFGTTQLVFYGFSQWYKRILHIPVAWAFALWLGWWSLDFLLYLFFVFIPDNEIDLIFTCIRRHVVFS